MKEGTFIETLFTGSRVMKTLLSFVAALDPDHRNWIKSGFFLLAVLGFCTQVIQVSILYFEYRTATQVKLDLRDFLTPHSYLICIRYGDILDRERLFKDTGRKVRQIPDLDEGIAEESTLTIQEIFEYTPKPEDVIKACFYRSSDMTFAVRQLKSCNQLFNVTKSFTLEFVCYRFQLKREFEQMPMEAAVQSRYKQYTIFDLTLNDSFKTANYLIPIAFVGRLPYESRRFSESALIRSIPPSDSMEYNWINVFSSDFIKKKLEAPYDTGCIRRENDDYHICKRDCLVSRFRKKFHKLPFTEFLEQPYNLKTISTAELEDPAIASQIRQVYQGCKRKCYFIPCYMIYTKTTFRTILFREFPLAFSAMTPTEADIVTEAKETMSFVEYFSFITGCFGTWFGLSFMSCEPAHRMRDTPSRTKQSCRKTNQPFFVRRNPRK